MKKFIIPLLVIYILSIGASGNTFTDEAWIGAYQFKELTPKERYLPYIDVRERNYRYSNTGSAIRTIKANSILIDNIPLFQEMVKNDSNDLTTLSELAVKTFNQISNRSEYIQKIRQYRAIVLLTEEIKENIRLLRMKCPEGYQYRFYHVMVAERDTTVPGVVKVTPTKFSSFVLPSAQYLMYGSYDAPFGYLEKEISDSKQATDRINAMMPIKASAFVQYTNTPFVTVRIEDADPNMKKHMEKKYGDKVKFRRARMVYVMVYIVDQDQINDIVQIMNPFSEEELQNIKNLFQSKFGTVVTEDITQINLREFLLSINV